MRGCSFACGAALLSSLFLVTLLIPCSALPVEIDFSVGVDLRTYSWEIFKKNLQVEDGETWKAGDYNPIEQINSNGGVSIGPEIELFIGKIYARGFYFKGECSFPVGSIDRTDAGIDLGIMFSRGNLRFGAFGGWRYLDETLANWSSLNIEEDDISNGGIGLALLTSPQKLGLIMDLRAFFGIGVLSNYEKPMAIDADLDLGYRFKTIPMAISIGYGLWQYWRPTAEREGYLIEGQENSAHGPLLKLLFTF